MNVRLYLKSILSGMLFFTSTMLAVGITSEPTHCMLSGTKYIISYERYNRNEAAHVVELSDDFGSIRIGHLYWDLNCPRDSFDEDGTLGFWDTEFHQEYRLTPVDDKNSASAGRKLTREKPLISFGKDEQAKQPSSHMLSGNDSDWFEKFLEDYKQD